MNVSRHDLNLLVYLDVLLRERNVTRAADRLNISQPAMSNGLKRLREMFQDPLLVRTSHGMEPTARALALQPVVHDILLRLESTLQSDQAFDPGSESRLFRIMASDYAATTVIPALLQQVQAEAPGLVLDIMTPSDVDFRDVEDGRIDMAINMFEQLPQSFYQKSLWRDEFCCALHESHSGADNLDLPTYLAADHVWVNKTGYGVGVGINPAEAQNMGWVDRSLEALGHRRHIRLFARDFHVAMHMAISGRLIATVPVRIAELYRNWPGVVLCAPPFTIPPVDLKLVWSPLLHHDQAHIWMRQRVSEAVSQLTGMPPT